MMLLYTSCDFIPNWEDFVTKSSLDTQIFPKGNKRICKENKQNARYTE